MKYFLTLLAVGVPAAYAHAQEYTFLVPPPAFIGNINTSGGVIAYINALFDLAVLIGAVIAVFVIASAGFQYMTTDAISHKKEGKERITQALTGLIMLLGIWIFFNQINPDILKLKGFDLPQAPTSSAPAQPSTLSGPGSNGNSFIGGSGGGPSLNGFGTGGAPNSDGTFNPEPSGS